MTDCAELCARLASVDCASILKIGDCANVRTEMSASCPPFWALAAASVVSDSAAAA